MTTKKKKVDVSKVVDSEDSIKVIKDIVESEPLEIEKVETGAIIQEPEYKQRCDTCFLLDNCPLYKEHEDCKIKVKVDLKDTKDFSTFVKRLINLSAERILKQYYVEINSGGVVTKELSEEIKRFMQLLKDTKELGDMRDTIEIRAKGSGIIKEMFGKFNQGGK